MTCFCGIILHYHAPCRWALPRNNATGRVTVDPKVFPSGIKSFSDYLHARGLKFGIYTSKGPLTCLGYQKTQPQRPGSCGYETIDAQTYAEWGVDQVVWVQHL